MECDFALNFNMAEDVRNFESAVENACAVFRVPKLFPEQEKALKSFIERKDVLLNLPTGFGKSLVFQMCPLVHAELSRTNQDFTSKPIIIVVSPLVSLMEDQTSYLKTLGIQVESIGEDKVANSKIENGECSIVYTSPESLLGNGRWRNMISSDVYKDNLIGIIVDEAHCISHWGTSTSQDAVAFRRWFFKLSELRSLVSKRVTFMAVTATATKKTKETIVSVLRLSEFVEVSETPNKINISYGVQYMIKQNSMLQYFKWLLDEIKEKQISTERTIIYCQTVKQCSTLYSIFSRELGKSIFSDSSENPRKRLVEMLHALSPKAVKEVVLKEMATENGTIRLLICTIAFGMGVNCKAVKRVIHFGPSKSVEAYIQESGRAGRDGSPSKAILLYQSLMLLHVDQDMKNYVKGKYPCRRQFLMSYFQKQAGISSSSNFICCDLCSKEADLAIPITLTASYEGTTRAVSPAHKKVLRSKLIAYRKSLLLEFLQQCPKGEVPVSSVMLKLLVGFTDHQIMQVVENCDKIFTMSDCKNYVEIWKERHAYAVLDILSQVFEDVDKEDLEGLIFSDFFDEEEEDGDDWNDLLNDSDLMQLNWDELSSSDMFADNSTILEDSKDLECSGLHAPDLGDVLNQVQIE